MLYRSTIGAVALAALCLAITGAAANDSTKYPDWKGQWYRIGNGNHDGNRPRGLGQQAPLTPEYQAILEASLADQERGGQGNDPGYRCHPHGMPRVMTVIRPIEFVIQPRITYVIFESYMPRRIYTDGRSFPTDLEPSMIGYSIGSWRDEDGDDRYDVLEIETRNFKGPRNLEATGLPLHRDNQTIVKERIRLDQPPRIPCSTRSPS